MYDSSTRRLYIRQFNVVTSFAKGQWTIQPPNQQTQRRTVTSLYLHEIPQFPSHSRTRCCTTLECLSIFPSSCQPHDQNRFFPSPRMIHHYTSRVHMYNNVCNTLPRNSAISIGLSAQESIGATTTTLTPWKSTSVRTPYLTLSLVCL